MLYKLNSILLVTYVVIISGCSLLERDTVVNGDSTTALRDVTYATDTQGNVLQTKIKVTGAELLQMEANKTDAEIAKSNSDCWGKILGKSEFDFTSGMTTEQMLLVSQGKMIDTLGTALMFSNEKFKPCPLATNSNDVAKAKELGKTERTKARWAIVPTALGITGGIVLGKAAFDSLENLGVAAISKAGTNIINNGDSNSVDVNNNDVDQNADNGSTISDSGNIDRAAGIPLNPADVNDVSLGSENPTEEVPENDEFSAACIEAGGNPRPISPEEVAAGIGVDGDIVCSDGNGGLIDIVL